MPASPNLPTTPPWPANGHLTFHGTLHDLANRLYRSEIGATRSAAFSVTQDMSGEVIPVQPSASIAITVVSLLVGTSMEFVRMSANGFTLTASGVTLLTPAGSTPTPRVQYSTLSLLWLTTTTVLVGGDLT